MDKEKQIDKIKKLLALGQSPNENEAKAALLKARELMAAYKIDEYELDCEDRRNVVSCMTDIDFSKRRNPWVADLSSIISSNYCCIAMISRYKGKQTGTVELTGRADDVKICTLVLEYAVDCVLSNTKNVSDKLFRDSFGYGFAKGVDFALRNQEKARGEKWALAMKIPAEVYLAVDKATGGKSKDYFSGNLDYDAYSCGYSEGKKFEYQRRLNRCEPDDDLGL